MYKAAIDWGNTRIKVGIFQENNLIEKFVSTRTEDILDFLGQYPKLVSAIISTVAGDPEAIFSQLHQDVRVFILSERTPLPFFNHYSTKTTQGKDRIAAVAGAVKLFPGEATLVIDAGTCLTYDFVDTKANYLGGIISPGVSIRLQAMHTFTAKLPLVELAQDTPTSLGDSTVACMRSGAFWGCVAEMEGIIENMKREKGEMKVLICGGDADRFESMIKAPIFAIPELVLIGLNAILEHNEV